MVANADIRKALQVNGVKVWELADKFGIYDSNMTRKLRHEFSDSDKAKALKFIDEIAAAHAAEG